jgi:hypothetical protein
MLLTDAEMVYWMIFLQIIVDNLAGKQLPLLTG